MLGQQIKKFRKQANIKQEDLAKQLGKSKSVISNWEKGINKPDANNIVKLCNIFNITPNQLFNWQENNSNLIKQYFEKLNCLGKQKALERIEELTELSKYTTNILVINSDEEANLVAKDEGSLKIKPPKEDPKKYFNKE